MTKFDDEKMCQRSEAIFSTGAKATEPKPTFQGAILGSMESSIFYDGYASTHPEFTNPYRRRQ